MRATCMWMVMCLAAVSGLFGGAESTLGQDNNAVLTAEAFKQWGKAETLFTGELVAVQQGPVSRSIPPIYSGRLQIVVDKVYRGKLKKGQKLQVFYSIRQMNPPVFPQGRMCLVSMKNSRKMDVVTRIVELTVKDLNIAKALAKIPVGWTMEKGKLLSPWAELKDKAWAGKKSKAKYACAVTGRPALLVGEGVEFKVEKVKPKVQRRFGNPDGDGEYKITVRNTSKKAVKVPALLNDGKNILWRESLVLICQGKVYPHPEARGVQTPTKATVLKPGQSVSTVVHALKLKGPMWPRGGYRIEFQFCLGEKSKTKSFYYLSKHHDPIRMRVQGK